MLKINKVNKKNKKEEIKHLPSKQAVEGSNPSAFTKTPIDLVDCTQNFRQIYN